MRAAATAMSTSFSVASWTEVMGFSVVGLTVSMVLPSTPFTNSLLMNLVVGWLTWLDGWGGRGKEGRRTGPEAVHTCR